MINNPRKIFQILLGFILILLILNIAGYSNIYFNNLDKNNYFFRKTAFSLEKNLPSGFSSILHLLASFLLASVAMTKYKFKTGRWFWWVLSFIFLFLSLDELFRIHENFQGYSSNAMERFGFFLYGWIVYYVAGLLILGVIIIQPLFKLPQSIIKKFLIAGCIFLLGAVVFENIAGTLILKENIIAEEVDVTPKLFFLSTLEELLEMIGVSYFIYSILLFKKDYMKS